MKSQLSAVYKALFFRKIAFDVDLIPLVFHHLPYRKIINWLNTETAACFKLKSLRSYPTLLQIEPTNRCNLNCPVCPSTIGLKRGKGMMPLALFKQLIDDLHPYLLTLLFWGWGEPFLHPRAYDMITIAKKKGLKVIASTNGHAFVDKRQAKQVVDSHLDVLVFSIDGIEQDTYARFRRHGKLSMALEGLDNVIQEKKRRRQTRPLVNLRFIVTRFNTHEIPQLQILASRLNVDALTLRRFHSISESGDQLQREQRFIPEDATFQIPVRTPEKSLTRVAGNPCKNLWNCPTIHWNGNVCSCFMDYDDQRPLGNLNESSFEEIWFGHKYRRLRAQFRTKWHKTAPCNRCSYGYQGGDIGRNATAKVWFF